ncbi:MAG: GxxExxY protein [Akkermansiaceae bacterium]
MDKDLNRPSSEIIGAAMKIHQALGPGLLNSTYDKALLYELRHRNMEVLSEVSLPISYKELEVRDAYRIDLVVDNTIILGVKEVQEITQHHPTQLPNDLHLAQKPLGLILNFQVPALRDGIARLINKPL